MGSVIEDFLTKTSWRTTALGVCIILGAIGLAGKALLDGDPNTSVELGQFWTTLLAGVALILARDNNKSSEDVGTK